MFDNECDRLLLKKSKKSEFDLQLQKLVGKIIHLKTLVNTNGTIKLSLHLRHSIE